MMPALRQQAFYLLLKAQALALLAFGNQAKALFRFDQMLALLPEDRYALASRAHVLAQLDRPDDSIVSLQQLICLAGSDAQQGSAWFNLGYVLQEKGRHDEACPAFEKATGHCPGMDRAWYGLGLALIQQGRLHEARNALKKATTLQPMAPHGWYRLAQVDLALGAPEKALQVANQLGQFEPKMAAQLKLDIGLHVALSNRQPNEAAHDNAR